MEYFIDLFLHLDKHLDTLVLSAGNWTYAILFLIIFCETGLVVTPILPGDSLLFAAGALAALSSLNIYLLIVLLTIAAILGDAVNYAIGRKLGMKAFDNPNSKIFKKEYLEKTQSFYERYGGKTIIIARFVPIVRTFAPFLAGVGKMPYSQFGFYNITGAIFWITSMTYAGYIFGGIEIVKKNFSVVVILIVILSILPAVFEVVRSRKTKNN
jgi:membrane-associated protein